MKKFYKYLVKVICLSLIIQFISVPVTTRAADSFSDVPEDHWAYSVIHQLKGMKITDGVGDNNFGLGLTITRSEFVAFLQKLMKWELVDPVNGSFIDNQNKDNWYYKYIETAVKYGVAVKDTELFRPDDPITREEMAVMIVRCLNYDKLAKQLEYLGSPFDDVNTNLGYITIAKDLEIIYGVGNNLFQPEGNALREHAAAMMMRMYQKLNAPVKELHGFYAIESYSQKNLIPDLNSVSFGWSRLEFDVKSGKVMLNTTRDNGNLFAVPDGFTEPVNLAKNNNIPAQLMVFAQNDIINIDNKSVGFVDYMLSSQDIRLSVKNSIISQINKTTKNNADVSFDGVVIDFEGLKGKASSEALNIFLSELKSELKKNGKSLYVAVHPERRPGLEYFDGYDYKTIGELADRVILMAHDYEAKALSDADMKNGFTETPLTPFEDIYYALKSITDPESGVKDKSKIMLQLSFGSAQWKLKNGVVQNRYPYNPGYDAILKRISQNAALNYSDVYQNPYIKFYDENDQTQNVIWYEDSRSVLAKLKLAGMFGIQGVSVWRLGIIPDFNTSDGQSANLDVWQKILSKTGSSL